MKKLALVAAAAAAIFAAVPVSAQSMHRDGMHRDGMHHGSRVYRGSMNRMRPHMHHNRHMMDHRHRGHMMR
jgi:hypothetical protein